jgi:hypothetical protein
VLLRRWAPLLAAACTAVETGDASTGVDTAEPDDTATPGDTADTADPTDTADTGGAVPLRAPADFVAAPWFTVPPDRGLAWQRDADFRIDEFTVPQLAVTADGRVHMYATNMAATGGRWHLVSDDGLSWTDAGAAFAPEDFLPLDCGDRLEDLAPLYRPGGALDLVVEGSYTPDPRAPAEWRRFCRYRDADPGPAVPDAADFYFTGGADDNAQISVHAFVYDADWSGRMYYVGNLAQPGEGIRVVAVDSAGTVGGSLHPGTILPDTDVDPMPVYLEGGGVRLYHTHGHGGGAGYADSVDGITFSNDSGLIPHGDNDCTAVGGECLLDPAFLHLPDDRLVLYFTRLVKNDDGSFSAWIERAFATD